MIPAAAVATVLVSFGAFETITVGGSRATHLLAKLAGAAGALTAAALAPILTVPGSILAIGLILGHGHLRRHPPAPPLRRSRGNRASMSSTG
jgi:uncharacterized membrane protein